MPLKILIIEDNQQNMYMLSFLLESAGFEIIQAFDGPIGIARAREDAPDIILLDIQLPGMDGYQVARALKQTNTLKNTPVIAVTSYAMAGDREKAMEAGANGYIEKPIDPYTFISQMEAFLPPHLLRQINKS